MANLNLQDILSGTGLGVGDIGQTQTQAAGTNVGDELAIAQSIGQTSNPLLGLLKGEQIFKAREKATRKGEVEEVLNQIKVAQAEVLQQKNQLENLKKADDAASRVAEQNAVLVGQNLNQAASLGDTAAGNAKVVDALVAGGRKPIGNVRWDRNTGMISGTFLVPDGAGGQTETPLTFRASDLVNSPEAKQALNLTIAGGNEQLLTARQELAAAPTAGQARLAETEAVLGRTATEAERQAEAGVLQRQVTGSPAEFEGTKQAIKGAEQSQVALQNIQDLTTQIEALPEEAFGASGRIAQGAVGIANALNGITSLVPALGEVSQDLTQFATQNVEKTALGANELESLANSLKFVTAGLFGQGGKAASDKDIKIMTDIIGNPQSFLKNKKQALKAIETLRTVAANVAGAQTGVAVRGAQPTTPRAKTREEILQERGL